jgi:xanthine dehydrogenase accessory factor
MNKLYELIKAGNPNHQNIVATVVAGDHLGDKVFFAENEILFETEKDGFLSQYRDDILGNGQSGMLTIAGSRVFREAIGTQKKLVICGAGHISIPIIRIGRMADFHVTVIEDRYSFAQNAERAGANRVICEPFEEGLAKVEGDANTYFVIVTRGHRYDQTCLEKIITKPNAYIGMIGSRLRVKKVIEQLVDKGVARERLDKVYTPIGLKIKAETPVEIAISIMAEIVSVKNQKKESCGYSKELLKAIELADDPIQNRKVLATIVSRKGSAPREAGSKMLIFADGRTVETLGGGCAESAIKLKAINMLREETAAPELHVVDMTGWEAEEEGMVCGGVIEVFLEVIE